MGPTIQFPAGQSQSKVLSRSFISSAFGLRDISDQEPNATTDHKGIDIPLPMNTDIKAVWTGKVKSTATGTGKGGDIVVLEHPNGLTTHYIHINQAMVTVGQMVQQGQVIAKSGNSGTSTTGPHLHFEIRENGTPVNPCGEKYLNCDGK